MRWTKRQFMAVAAAAFSNSTAWAAERPPIAAASDLSAALPEVVRAFERKTGQQVRVTFGSSGNFTQQIRNAAPFELFLSADEAYVQQLQAAGRTRDGGALYAVGRIGLFVPRGSRLKLDPSLRDVGAAARDGRLMKFAIANPEHAPYGRAAREALHASGVWPAVEPKLVLGENVSQATQFATSGSAQGGIIPLSLASTPQVKAAGRFVLIPADRHRPLRQRMVLMKGAGPTAERFYAFLQGQEAKAILRRYGFSA
ncbi:molybdate ABC transporter substrate-binding protein [Phenylobacterium deserti]|uniref:Molybdate ABC transporter substrate-binding protein n=2 Tax=Phenylobacterium deserti TaxID=1914756 RepID=A0A328AAE1_9CAUL|nr:molybdate ABC transporter substrate-binding protein [Phenylobacterium deserti]